jgi:hypothetical protein
MYMYMHMHVHVGCVKRIWTGCFEGEPHEGPRLGLRVERRSSMSSVDLLRFVALTWINMDKHGYGSLVVTLWFVLGIRCRREREARTISAKRVSRTRWAPRSR